MKNLNSISKLAIAMAGSSLIIFANTSVFAASKTDNSKAADSLSATAQTDLANLKSKGESEITRRITSLNSAESKISSTTKLSSSDQAYLENEVNNEISGLTTLKTTLSGETTLAAARSDVQSIFSDYRVYALLLPKIRIITAADSEQATSTKLTTLEGQLQTKINNAKSAGNDVTTLQTDLNTMQTDSSNAQSIAAALESSVLTLQPTNYDNDHTILSGDLSQLKTAHTDNVNAYNEGKTIVSALEN